MRKATFPAMGYYTEAFEYLARELGFEPIPPPKTTQATIKKGVRHSSEMVCFPFKATLGNLIEGLEAGATDILVVGVEQEERPSECRFGYYYHVQENILKRLGYKFNTHYMRPPALDFIKSLKKIAPHLGYWQIWKIMRNAYKKIKDIEKKHYTFEKKEINIGLVGEAYTLWTPTVNYDIVAKLKKLGCGVDMSITLSWFIRHKMGIADMKKHLQPEVRKYFPKRIAAHGYESIYNTIHYANNNFDGVIHLLPLSCMPESMVEMVITQISEDYGIPVYRFPLDENRFEVGFDTRLETFVKLLKRNKNVSGN